MLGVATVCYSLYFLEEYRLRSYTQRRGLWTLLDSVRLSTRI